MPVIYSICLPTVLLAAKLPFRLRRSLRVGAVHAPSAPGLTFLIRHLPAANVADRVFGQRRIGQQGEGMRAQRKGRRTPAG